jgi:hypothetical protein
MGNPGSPHSWYQSHPDCRRPYLAWALDRKSSILLRLIAKLFLKGKAVGEAHCNFYKLRFMYSNKDFTKGGK